jgi:hypothetical protein
LISVAPKLVPAEVLLSVFNSNVFSFFLKKFIAHTWMAQISDIRMMPITIPTNSQIKRLTDLADRAMASKNLSFTGGLPSNDLVAFVRRLSNELTARASKYLQPSAQLRLVSTAADCLAVIELAVNWEVEKLYGVEGLGPFNEF